eukprot:jgi/Picsp_1/5926/NSC_03283-R1_---NA---
MKSDLRFLIFVLAVVATVAVGQRDYETCVGLVEGAEEEFHQNGEESMVQAIARQYVTNPSGPYLYCYNNIKEGQKDALQTVRSVHPYLALGDALGDTVATMSRQSAQTTDEDYQKASLQAIEICCHNLFNFSLSFDQTSSESSGEYVEGSRRDYVAFSEKVPDGTYLYCACPFTNIPEGVRNNSNAATLLQEVQSASSSAVWTTTMSNVLFVLSVVFLLHDL